MNNSEKMQAIEELQNVLDLLKERAEKLEIKVKAQEAMHVVDDNLAAVRSNLRDLVDTYNELHIDLNGEIYRIYKKDGTKNDVVIEPFLIDCKRITTKT